MNSGIQNEITDYTDAELFEKIVYKERWAFSVIYDRYSPRLYGLALKILKDQTQAEDVLQEIFIAIWTKADQYNSRRGTHLAWMTILCRNRCIDALRKLEKDRQRSSVLDESIFPVVEDDPLQNIHHEEIQAILKESFTNLSSEQRTVIEMAYFEGFSQSEIAKNLSLPVGTVKTRVRLGMQKLRDSLLNTTT